MLTQMPCMPVGKLLKEGISQGACTGPHTTGPALLELLGAVAIHLAGPEDRSVRGRLPVGTARILGEQSRAEEVESRAAGEVGEGQSVTSLPPRGHTYLLEPR